MGKTESENKGQKLFPFSFSLGRLCRIDSSLYSEILKILLSDRSRKRNIIWATDAYEGRAWESPIRQNEVSLIRPRAFKEDAEKQARIKTHAEVFTPFEVVSRMTKALWGDPEGHDKTYLEIACGEAPFITSRYDAATGTPVALQERVGILDRKLQEAGKAAEDDEDWMERAEDALKSVYGYEFQGDSLFIARANVLDAFLENFETRFGRVCDPDLLLKEASIVSWNFWQMDGRTQAPPVKGKSRAANDLFNDNPPCRIRFWDQSRSTPFSNIGLEERKSMKRFYAVIGNPPYQNSKTQGGGNFHPSIYPDFIRHSEKVADKVELITPARFLTNAKEKSIYTDPHFTVLYKELESKKVFPNVEVKGGVCIFLWDRERSFASSQSSQELDSIKEKVWDRNQISLKNFVYPKTSYHFSKKAFEDYPQLHTTDLGSPIFSTLDNILFFVSKPNDGNEYARILGRKDRERVYRFIRKDYVRGPESFGKFKVFVPQANGSGAIGEVLSTPLIGQPLIGHTQTFISIGSFDTESEADACLKYIKSKFARAMLGILKVTQNNAKDTWQYVPWQDFSHSSDIDWTQSIPDIDRQLYAKYGLSNEEIQFIESHVKEME